jgi:hypothetical protein
VLNRRIIAYILIVSAILVPVGIASSKSFLPSVAQATPNQSSYFEDHFGGTGLDSTKWNNSLRQVDCAGAPSEYLVRVARPREHGRMPL